MKHNSYCSHSPWSACILNSHCQSHVVVVDFSRPRPNLLVFTNQVCIVLFTITLWRFSGSFIMKTRPVNCAATSLLLLWELVVIWPRRPAFAYEFMLTYCLSDPLFTLFPWELDVANREQEGVNRIMCSSALYCKWWLQFLIDCAPVWFLALER